MHGQTLAALPKVILAETLITRISTFHLIFSQNIAMILCSFFQTVILFDMNLSYPYLVAKPQITNYKHNLIMDALLS